MNQPPGLTIRVNYLKSDPDKVEKVLKQAKVNYKKGEFLEEYFTIVEGSLEPVRKILDDGKIYIQDQSAGMPVRLLNPRPGMNVLDLAAAPGGKTTYAASRMRGKGNITAVDKSRKRLKLLVENCERLGIKNVSPVSCDANDFAATKKFERVMVDPPCTGWGNAGKHADLRWVKKPEDITQMKRIQKRMLDHAASLVSPGGILVYSTCSIIREENDQVVEEFLLSHKEFQLESAKKFWDKRVVSERGFLKTYPNIPGLDGAFAARLKLRPN
ncbi:MAG: RsmB/NOP family class I SAM-dependent RNA methyltransferase [candidate division Zixibacteria bacterium]|nr:RsmB/NOP family class I SAM-dependent RNA methyltransferase [candidate division Zixibacteria bacterium]